MDRNRKIAIVAAAAGAVTASGSMLLKHSGRADISDTVLGLAVGVLIGLAIVFLVKAKRQAS